MATILIVDDSATIRLTISLMLRKEYTILTAVNGQDALEKLSHNSVDLIISDIHMPKMDGHELLRHIRADKQYCQTPIIMLSQSSDHQDQLSAQKCGVNHYIAKPVSTRELVATVNRFIHYKGHFETPVTPPPIDQSILLSLMADDEAEMTGFLAEALPLFQKESSSIVQSMAEAVDENNLKAVRLFSHNLMGCSGSMGAAKLADLCFEMEMAACQNVPEDMPAKLNAIKAEIDRIQVYADTQFSPS